MSKSDRRWELSIENIGQYTRKVVLPRLHNGASVTGVREVTENSFVNWVFAVSVRFGDTHEDETIYVRQSRDHARQDSGMHREVSRTASESRALDFLGRLEPGLVPNVILFDRTSNVLVLEDIRRGGHLLADELAAGRVHAETGRYLGKAIGRIQAVTAGQSFAEILGSDVAPPKARTMSAYLGLRTAKAREVAPELTELILAASDAAPSTFLLGDLASKNIFVDGEDERFLDLERVTVGDPAYDPAYLFCHYVVEAQGERAIGETLEYIHNFMWTYLEQVGQKFSHQELRSLQQRILHHLGISILHRTQGTYLGGYLGSDQDAWLERSLKFMTSVSGVSVEDVLEEILER